MPILAAAIWLVAFCNSPIARSSRASYVGQRRSGSVIAAVSPRWRSRAGGAFVALPGPEFPEPAPVLPVGPPAMQVVQPAQQQRQGDDRGPAFQHGAHQTSRSTTVR